VRRRRAEQRADGGRHPADAGRNELIRTVTEVTDAAGERVATLHNTIVSRGTAAPRDTEQEA
jgi:hypothetical protein